MRGVGLELNRRKCELTILNRTEEEEIQTLGRFKKLLPELKLVSVAKLLAGSLGSYTGYLGSYTRE